MNLRKKFKYEGCPESIRPFWISREPVAWPWCNLVASQRRPYCAFMNSHSPVGLVSRQWDAVDWACVLCDRHTYSQCPSEQISFITTLCLPILQLSCRLFRQSIKSLRSVSPPPRPYSPDLAPCDLRLIPKLKSPLKARRFVNVTASHYRLTSPTGEWLFADAQ